MTALYIYFGALTLWACFLVWQWRRTKTFANELYAQKRDEGVLVENVDQAGFVDIFIANEGPRRSTYFFGAALVITVLIAPYANLVNTVWNAIWNTIGGNPVFRVGTIVHAVFLFVMIGVFMGGVLAFAMSRFHKQRPPALYTLEK